MGIKRKMNDSAFPFSFLGFMKNASAKQTIIIFVSFENFIVYTKVLKERFFKNEMQNVCAYV